MLSPAEPIATERLDLEPLRVDHAAEMVAVLGDRSLYEHIGGWPPSLAELTAQYERQTRGVSPDGREAWFNWVLRDRASGRPVGVIQATVAVEDGSPRAELAWIVGVREQGRGYATEGAAAAMTWLADQGCHPFVAHIRPRHSASAAVATRLGFERTAAVRHGEERWTAGS